MNAFEPNWDSPARVLAVPQVEIDTSYGHKVSQSSDIDLLSSKHITVHRQST